MKKGLAFVLTAAFCLAALTGCGSSKTETKAAETKAETTAETKAAEETQASGETTKLTVAASPTPHAEILNAAKDILKEKNIDRNEVVAIGDNINDKEMIEEAGLGVAMGNSTPVIKEVANVEVGTNNEEGVRETFQKYINI